jgi:hypothetical protein
VISLRPADGIVPFSHAEQRGPQPRRAGHRSRAVRLPAIRTAVASGAASALGFPQQGGTKMRHGVFIALTTGFLAAAAHGQTDPARATYVTLVLQAFAAKVECPGTDVVYQDLLQKAQEMHLPDGTTEAVRKAIAFLHTGGKLGERGDDSLMKEVAIATQSTDFDQRRLGMANWCETQKSSLAGFIRTKQ